MSSIGLSGVLLTCVDDHGSLPKSAKRSWSLMRSSLKLSRVPTNAMTATISPPSPDLQSGYHMHPSLMDATLHLLAAALFNRDSKPATTMLPVGMDAIACSGIALKDQALSIAQPSSNYSKQSVLCQYKMFSNQYHIMHIKDLIAREAKTFGNPKHMHTSDKFVVPSSKLLYELHWQVEKPKHSCLVHNITVSNGEYLKQFESVHLIHQPDGLCMQHKQQSNQSSSCQSDHLRDDDGAKLECNKAEIKSSEPVIATMQLVNRLLQIWQNMSAEWQYKQVILITRRHLGTYMARADSSDYVHEAFAALMRVAAAENPNMQIACLTTDLMAKPVRKVCQKE